MGKIVAIIPAAGYSKRMGLYKPLLPLASSLVIEKTVMSLYEAGIEEIFVVAGYKAELLKPVLQHLGVRVIVNQDYDCGMYSSIQTGVRALTGEMKAFFLLPADCAFVNPRTIRQLAQAYKENEAAVIYPIFKGQKGHPPLISTSLKDVILNCEPKDGLKEILRERAEISLDFPVEDPGVLQDLDKEEEYRKLLPPTLAAYPSRAECQWMLNKYNVESQVIKHVLEVNRVAVIIAEHLNSHGLRLHAGLVMASSLLHDIAKGQPNHARIGGQIVTNRHYPEVGDIIASHMELPRHHIGGINEYTVVYLADKMVQNHRLVPLQSRLWQQLEKYGDDRIVQRAIWDRFRDALYIKYNIEKFLNKKLENILGLNVKCGESYDRQDYLAGSTCRTSSA